MHGHVAQTEDLVAHLQLVALAHSSVLHRHDLPRLVQPRDLQPLLLQHLALLLVHHVDVLQELLLGARLADA